VENKLLTFLSVLDCEEIVINGRELIKITNYRKVEDTDGSSTFCYSFQNKEGHSSNSAFQQELFRL